MNELLRFIFFHNFVFHCVCSGGLGGISGISKRGAPEAYRRYEQRRTDHHRITEEHGFFDSACAPLRMTASGAWRTLCAAAGADGRAFTPLGPASSTARRQQKTARSGRRGRRPLRLNLPIPGNWCPGLAANGRPYGRISCSPFPVPLPGRGRVAH